MQLSGILSWYALIIWLASYTTTTAGKHVHSRVTKTDKHQPASTTPGHLSESEFRSSEPDSALLADELMELFNSTDLKNTPSTDTTTRLPSSTSESRLEFESVPSMISSQPTASRLDEEGKSQSVDANQKQTPLLSPVMPTDNASAISTSDDITSATNTTSLNTTRPEWHVPGEIVDTTVQPTPRTPSNSTSDDLLTLSELIEALKNLTEPTLRPMDKDNETGLLQNVTTVTQLTDKMVLLNISSLFYLKNIASAANNSLIQNLLNATEEANVTTVEQLRNISEILNVDDIVDITAILDNVSSAIGNVTVNTTEHYLTNSSVYAPLNSTIPQQANISQANISESTVPENVVEGNVTKYLSGLNESRILKQNVSDETLPGETTTEFSRLETASNEEFWQTTERPSTTPNTKTTTETATTEEYTVSSQSTTTESISTVMSSESNQTEPLGGMVNWNDPQFGGLVTALVFGCLFVLILTIFVGKRLYDGYQRRHYTKMDYLVNGMYN